MQQWFNLSDPGVEEAPYESVSMRTFAGINLGRELAPVETTVCKFRRLREERGLDIRIFEAVGAPQTGEGIAAIENFTVREFEQRLLGGEIVDSFTVAAYTHARLRGLSGPPQDTGAGAAPPVVKTDFYASKERVTPPTRPVEARLADPDAEVEQTISEHQFASEAERCFSCGLCFGCEHCFMYCNPGAYTRFEQVRPGMACGVSVNGPARTMKSR